MKTCSLVIAGFGIAAGLAAGPWGRQESQQPPRAQKPLRVQVNLVDLFATVRDRHHEIVPNLTKDDFRIYEDGKPQQVAYFSRDLNQPITLGLLIDTSGSQEGLLGAEQEAASQFIRQILRKDDMAMVISFGTDVDLLADFTEDKAILERAIRRTQINAGGPPPSIASTPGPFPQLNATGTAFYDAVYLACHDELAGQAGRKALVILTDAQDEGSKLKMSDAIEAAQRANTVIHIILINNVGGYFAAGMAYNGGSVAKKMAEETGGRVIEVHSGKKLEEAFEQISEELRSQYVLGYYPANTAHDGTFRKIKVETTRPGLHVLARKGYYAPNN